MQGVLDTRALEIAAAAKAALETHSANCVHDNAEVRAVMKEMRDDMRRITDCMSSSFSRLHERIDKIFRTISGTLIVLLLGVLGYLLTSGVPWKL